MKDTKTIIFFCILIGLAISADEQQPVVEKVVVEE
jgi:Na+/H+-dicarboxylate symporter